MRVSLERVDRLSSFADECESDERQNTVYQEHLQPELVSVEDDGRINAEHVAEEGRKHADYRDKSVFYLKAGEYSEREQSEEGPIGVSRYSEHRIDHTLLVDLAEDDDDDKEEQ